MASWKVLPARTFRILILVYDEIAKQRRIALFAGENYIHLLSAIKSGELCILPARICKARWQQMVQLMLM